MILYNRQTKNARNRKATAPLQQQQQNQKRFKSGVIGSVDRQKNNSDVTFKKLNRIEWVSFFQLFGHFENKYERRDASPDFPQWNSCNLRLNGRRSQYSIVIRFSASVLFENFGNFWSY